MHEDSDNDGDDDDDEDDEAPPKKKKTGGRMRNPIWDLFSDDEKVQTKSCAPCKHCSKDFNFYQKHGRIVNHLKKCHAFKTWVFDQDQIEIKRNCPPI